MQILSGRSSDIPQFLRKPPSFGLVGIRLFSSGSHFIDTLYNTTQAVVIRTSSQQYRPGAPSPAEECSLPTPVSPHHPHLHRCSQSDVHCLSGLLKGRVNCLSAVHLRCPLAGVGDRHHLAKMPPALGRWLAEAEAVMETEPEAEAEIAPSAARRLIPLPMLLLPLSPLLWRCYCLPLLLLLLPWLWL
ncbi:hypothetical protein B484DRAFT_145382 [Ochromonadaceae sp. CCMP2298]|nr:hypothetical protein B484DRAFT_145382 [Ochromonadaceae sp. CCMP2298]